MKKLLLLSFIAAIAAPVFAQEARFGSREWWEEQDRWRSAETSSDEARYGSREWWEEQDRWRSAGQQ